MKVASTLIGKFCFREVFGYFVPLNKLIFCVIMKKEAKPMNSGISAIKILTMEEERLLYSMITSKTPRNVKKMVLYAIEEFEEQRSI
ncbi:MAG: hypothetical protein ACFFAE_07970 [Candidatus Hodarchaeota archaeon]